MVDNKWLKDGDKCATNPKECVDGFSMAIWEKNTFPKDLLTPLAEQVPDHWLDQPQERKYLVTSGPVPLFNRSTGVAFSGFEIYRQVNIKNKIKSNS